MKTEPTTETEFCELLKVSKFVPIVTKLELKGNFTATELFEKIYKNKFENTFLFESNSFNPKTATNSYFGKVGKIVTLENSKNKTQKQFRRELENLIKKIPKTLKFDFAPFFFGGNIVLASYGLVRAFEKIPFEKPFANKIPDFTLAETKEVFCFNQNTKELSLSLIGKSEKDFLKLLEKAEKIFSTLEKPVKNTVETAFSVSEPKSNFTKRQFEEIVSKIKNYIFEGDVYQVNISQKFQAKFEGNAFSLFKSLNKINPSPFCCFVNLKNFTVVSSSPERLLLVEDGFAQTRPIGGTRKRGFSEKEDNKLTEKLLLNEKERAEHTMLVDLERNDLGRICEFGSVKVDEFMVVENYSHVKHIVSNVVGKLFPNLNFLELLRAMFPGGTLTGCPKVRCLEIIEELETLERGLYAGSIGFLNFDGNLDLNIVIRTFVVFGEELEFQVGAGIVADSDPESEYFETLQKAKALLTSIGREIIKD